MNKIKIQKDKKIKIETLKLKLCSIKVKKNYTFYFVCKVDSIHIKMYIFVRMAI